MEAVVKGGLLHWRYSHVPESLPEEINRQGAPGTSMVLPFVIIIAYVCRIAGKLR